MRSASTVTIIKMNNRNYFVFFESGSMSKDKVITAKMELSNGKRRKVTNRVTLAKAAALAIEELHAEALEIDAASELLETEPMSDDRAWSLIHLDKSHTEALEINEVVSLKCDTPIYMPHLIIKRCGGGYALNVSDIQPKTTFNPLAASFWYVIPDNQINEREERSKMRQFMNKGDSIISIGEAVKETMKFALGSNWIEIVRRWERGE